MRIVKFSQLKLNVKLDLIYAKFCNSRKFLSEKNIINRDFYHRKMQTTVLFLKIDF